MLVAIDDIRTHRDADTAALRTRRLTSGGLEVRCQEEQSRDSEVSHGAGAANLLVFEGGGPI